MTAAEIIRKKRDGGELSSEEIEFIIQGYLRENIPDYQISSWLMAIYFRGMTNEETVEFTRLMLHSGKTIDLSHINGIKVDKHSTGGVGDKISLLLAPIVAACGVPVPMISGRGLGHTGGTLDKLESIPGFRTNLSEVEFKRVLSEIGLVMIGQTKDIAPADKKMYALRDVTATIECIPLIAGSILSKKLAEGIDGLVLDVKTGHGAFMQSHEKSLELAQTLVNIGTNFGKETVGLITDMNQPLGYAIGNWCEVVESIECLQQRNISDIMELTFALGGCMLMLAKKASTISEAIEKCKEVIKNGKAFDKFLQLVQQQNGDVSYIKQIERYPISKHSEEVKSSLNGYITRIDSLELGLINITLGAGRTKTDDIIDPKAGIILKKKLGDVVKDGDVLATFFTDKPEIIDTAKRRISDSFTIGSLKPQSVPLIISYVDKNGVKPFAY